MPLDRQPKIFQTTIEGFESLPTKTAAAAEDFAVMIDTTGIPYKITKANLFAGLSSGGGDTLPGGGDTLPGGGTSAGNELIFGNSGDNKGLAYFLGTQKNTTSWANPSGVTLNLSASSIEFGNLASLVNRDDSEFYSNIQANNWVTVQLVSGKLKCNYYSIKTRSNNIDYYPRNWKLQGSNNGSDWIDLDSQVNNISLNAPSQWLSLPVISSVAYSWFRLLQNGVDSSGVGYLCLSELEFYGLPIP